MDLSNDSKSNERKNPCEYDCRINPDLFEHRERSTEDRVTREQNLESRVHWFARNANVRLAWRKISASIHSMINVFRSCCNKGAPPPIGALPIQRVCAARPFKGACIAMHFAARDNHTIVWARLRCNKNEFFNQMFRRHSSNSPFEYSPRTLRRSSSLMKIIVARKMLIIFIHQDC